MTALVLVVGEDLDRAERAGGAGHDARLDVVGDDGRRGDTDVGPGQEGDAWCAIGIDAVLGKGVVQCACALDGDGGIAVVIDDVVGDGGAEWRVERDGGVGAVADVKPAVAADRVAQYLCTYRGAGKADANGVAQRSPDRVADDARVVTAKVDADGGIVCPNSKGVAGVDAKGVANDLVARAVPGDRDPVPADDQVALACQVAADAVVAGTVVQVYAILAIGNGRRAGGVGADVIAGYDIVDGAGVDDEHARTVGAGSIAAEQVARAATLDSRPRVEAADEVVGGAIIDPHAIVAVVQCRLAGDVDADVITADSVVRRARVADAYAVVLVAGDEVAFAGAAEAGGGVGAANEIVACAVLDYDTIAAIGDGRRAGDVCADIVADDCVAHGATITDRDAVPPVPAYQVAFAGRRAADGVVRDASPNLNAVDGVAQGSAAAGIDSDIVARNRIGHRT